MSTNSAPLLPPTVYKRLTFKNKRGALVEDFLGVALEVERTKEFRKATPYGCTGMSFTTIKCKNAGRLDENEASYVGLLFFRAIEKMLKDGSVLAEHETSGELRKLFSKDVPWKSRNMLLMSRQWKQDEGCFILRGMRPEGIDPPHHPPHPEPTIIVPLAGAPGNRCHVGIAVWNGVHFTQESKDAFELGVRFEALAPPEDKVKVDLCAPISENDKAWIERRIRILHHSFAANDTTFPFDVQDVGKICRFVIPALAEDNLLQKVRSPVSICGAVHGDYTKLRNAVTFGKRNERVRRAPRRING
jgi:hypothetical protein